MNKISATILTLLLIVGVAWGYETHNRTQYASNDSVQRLADTVNAMITSQQLDTVINQIWDLKHSGLELAEKDYKELEKLEIEKGLLIEKLKKLK